jgi:thioredoxin reductase
MTKTNERSFPWTNSHPWDVDILVIGGGPAGLSAVTRLRWMKTCNPTPLSVVLVNSGPLGGLAKLGNSILTGPGLAFPAGELVHRLKQDLKTYPAPIIDQKVVSITKDNDLFITTLEDGSTISSVSVIMACGMLDLRNIHQFWQHGVTATFGNRANILTILKRELSSTKKPVILGGVHLLHLQQTILQLNPATTLLIDDTSQQNTASTIYGELNRIEQGVEEMELHIHSQTQDLTITTDRIIVEFNSIELNRPGLPHGLSSGPDGYLVQESTPGLYNAGDCGGPPFSAVVALGEGVKAGLSAYQYTHQFKYGIRAPLFAYYGDDSVIDGHNGLDDFNLHDALIPARLVRECPKDTSQELWGYLNGATSLKDLTAKGFGDKTFIYKHITTLLEQRAITFCPQRDRM